MSRGWGRSRARDYYDLWRIMGAYRGQLDLTDFRTFLHRKCDTRGVSFQRVDDFFEPTILAHVRDTWSQWLGPLVSDLPAFDTVVSDLRPQIAALLSSDG